LPVFQKANNHIFSGCKVLPFLYVLVYR